MRTGWEEGIKLVDVGVYNLFGYGMVKHGAVAFWAEPDADGSDGLGSYLLAMCSTLLAIDFDVCDTEHWDKIT